MCLEPIGESVRFSETFAGLAERSGPAEWSERLLEHHRKTQRRKPPNGKIPWFERFDDGSVMIPFAKAIAIKGDRILAVDSTEKINQFAGPKTRRIDLHGRVVIPGIIDTHIHLGGAQPPNVTNIDFGEWAPSCKKVLDTIAQRVTEVPAGN